MADYIIAQRGSCRGSFICGRSVHNQRIECLWGDDFSACLVLYYCLFNQMKNIGILDINEYRPQQLQLRLQQTTW